MEVVAAWRGRPTSSYTRWRVPARQTGQRRACMDGWVAPSGLCLTAVKGGDPPLGETTGGCSTGCLLIGLDVPKEGT